MNAKMITTMERRRYFKPTTQVIIVEMNRILCDSTDYWGYAPGQNPADTVKLA